MLWRRAPGAKRRGPLIVLLHGHGADERDIFALGDLFPPDATIAAPRGAIVQDAGFRWFAAHAVQRPDAESLADGIARLEGWLDAEAAAANGVWLVGFSGGALMAGALALHAPHRYAGVAMLHGALPFDAGLPIVPGRLAHGEVFYGYGTADDIIPVGLIERLAAWLRDDSGANAEIRAYRAAHKIRSPKRATSRAGTRR